MATVNRFEDLEVWKKARNLSIEIHKKISAENMSKDYRLKDQMNGSSGSIMDNIAEGFSRGGNIEFINFLSYAKGSAGELKSQLYRTFDRKYITQEKFDELYKATDEIGKMISALIVYLNKTVIKGDKFKNRQTNGAKPTEN